MEIPQGSRIKIQGIASQRPQDTRYRVDRITDTPFPVAYGFIHGTLSPDGDPQDLFLISRTPIQTGDRFQTQDLTPLGTLQMEDDHESDPKEIYFLGSQAQALRPDNMKFILQKMGQILVHLKTYKLRVGPQGVIQGRIQLKGLRLTPLMDRILPPGSRILPYRDQL